MDYAMNSGNWPYFLSLILMVGIGILAAFDFTDSLFPDAHDFDLTSDSEAVPTLWDWIFVKDLPLSFFLVLFFGLFGAGGLAFVDVAEAANYELHEMVRATAAVIFAFAGTHVLGRYLRGLVGIQTTAVSLNSLIGRSGEVTCPEISRGSPGDVKVYDDFGQAHYLFCEPVVDNRAFLYGEKVVVESRADSLFLVRASN